MVSSAGTAGLDVSATTARQARRRARRAPRATLARYCRLRRGAASGVLAADCVPARTAVSLPLPSRSHDESATCLSGVVRTRAARNHLRDPGGLATGL